MSVESDYNIEEGCLRSKSQKPVNKNTNEIELGDFATVIDWRGFEKKGGQFVMETIAC